MPANKSQHYLPRFMMRNFGINKEQVHLYNLKSRKCIFSVGIAGQCAKDYFYSKNTSIEKAIGLAETDASRIIAGIISGADLPAKGSVEQHKLISFIALQHGRTPGAAAELNELINDMGKKLLEEGLKAKGNQEKLLEHLPSLRIERNNSTLENVLEFSLMAPLLRDLTMDVLEAGDDQDFMIGDDPVVLTNKYAFTHNKRPNCGFAVKGLIVLMPVSPKKTLMLSDPLVYEKESRNKLSVKQTIALNKLQMRHATANVYFQEHHKVKASLGACSDLETFARYTESLVGSVPMDGKQAIFMAHAREAMNMPSEIVLKLKFSAKRRREKGEIDFVRNREMADLVRQVMQDPSMLKS